jgi:dihydrofolate reductase
VRKLVVTEFITLDGIIEAPNEWSFPFWNDEIAKYKLDELFACDTVLLGRVTYEGFAGAWPSRTDEAGFADRMNSIAKYVVSTTLNEAPWNNSTILRGNFAQEITLLKQQAGMNILVAGSATLIQALAQENLIDEYQMLVYPVVRGGGKRLFAEGSAKTLKLIHSQQFGSVVNLVYQPG